VRSAALVLLCCGACSLFRGTPKYDYYVLTPTRALAQPRSGTGTDQPSVGVSHVSIPGYLDRESIVTRTDDFRLSYSKQDRWAEPLDQAFERTLRQELAATLAPSGIEVSDRAAPTYDVQVDVLRFERRGANRVELWARWTLRSDGEVVRSDESRIEVAIPGPGNAAGAAALSSAIARLAVEIGKQVQIATRDSARTHRPRPAAASTNRRMVLDGLGSLDA
jgi:uncharacterized lipoprotein YmbA